MKLVVGNQKAYLNRNDVLNFIDKTREGNCDNVVICPSSLYLDLYLDKSKYLVGSQDVSEKGNGATTGEISAEQLNSLGVSYSIVGHSERSDSVVEPMLSKHEIIPIFCVGEHLEDKENNITKDIVGRQIMEVFDNLNPDDMEKIIVAYEPVWSIGTGKIPTNEDIEDITYYIKDLVQDKYGKRVSVLYGGSVNQKNIDTLNLLDVVDGYLIGGASTKPEEFLYIMSALWKREFSFMPQFIFLSVFVLIITTFQS